MSGVGRPPFEPVDFGAFHAHEVPGLLAGTRPSWPAGRMTWTR